MSARGTRAGLSLVLAVVVGLGVFASAGAAVADTAAVPSAPVVLSPARSILAWSSCRIVGRVGPTVTRLSVTGARTATWTLSPADSTGATFTATVTLAYGKTDVRIEAGDGATWSAPTVLPLWRLGRISPYARFVLVDKSDFMLYVVRSRTVIASFPVAIGTGATPTPTGTFWLARPVSSPNAVWGIFRMPLTKRRSVRVSYVVRIGGHSVRRWRTVVRYTGTYYYIHGTNEPDSIGTPASHGCVRLYNRDLRTFSRLADRYEPTYIRQ